MGEEFTIKLKIGKPTDLLELLGFLKGLKAANKDAPGYYALKEICNTMQKVEK